MYFPIHAGMLFIALAYICQWVSLFQLPKVGLGVGVGAGGGKAGEG